MKEMSRIVRTVANITFPFMLIFGFYIVLHGHLTPGGGFQGGAVVGSAVALIIVAHGGRKAATYFNKKHFGLAEATALLIFIMVALAGIIAGAFFYNFLTGKDMPFGDQPEEGSNLGNLNTGGTVPIMNIAVGLEVVCAFGVILMYLLQGLKYAKEDETVTGGES